MEDEQVEPRRRVRWDRFVDRWVRVKSRRLDDRTLLPRKLLHTSLVVVAWPILRLDRGVLIVILVAICLFVAISQRRPPYASLGLLTLLTFAGRTAVGGGWAVFTAGDGLSAIAGRLVGGPRLPWNRQKSWAGSITFLLTAGLALFVLLSIRASTLSAGHGLELAVLVAGAGAFMESLDIPLDDNYSVIVVAGTLLHLLLL